MTIQNIRSEMQEHIGKKVNIHYDLGRNKSEELNAIIKNLYNYIFIVELPNKEIRSFSYSDIITKTIKIDFKLWNYCNLFNSII